MVLESPTDSRIQAEIDPTHAAVRSSLHPWEHNTAHQGGHFSIAMVSGDTTGLAAGAAILSLRWTNPDRLFFLQRLKVTATLLVVYAAAQENAIELVKVGTFINNDTGGTDIGATIGQANRKSGRNMAASSIGDLRICGAGALGLGASTVPETNAMRAGALALGNTAFNVAERVLFDVQPGLEHPLELQRFEGFRLRNIIAQGAAGVVRFRVEMDWLERALTEAAG